MVRYATKRSFITQPRLNQNIRANMRLVTSQASENAGGGPPCPGWSLPMRPGMAAVPTMNRQISPKSASQLNKA
jgi:hypothetical protein